MAKLNGILVISLESGMLLFSEEIALCFGLSPNVGADSMQLASLLFALYTASEDLGSDGEEKSDCSLSWISFVN